MKKFLFIASLMLSFAGIGFAQTAAPAKPVKKDKVVKATTTTPATTTTAAKPATAATTGGPTKKDGTADMRYKANKDAKTPAPATTHVKKDGTPDKRFKENKTPAKKS